jgi:hypothetical protein
MRKPFKTWKMTAQALPSCLLRESEANEVRRCTATVEIQTRSMGKVSRNRMIRLALDKLRNEVPRYHGCPDSLGGMTFKEPEVKETP